MRVHRRLFGLLCAASLEIAGASIAFASEPYIPTNDSVVLETLPRTFFAGRDSLAKIRRQLAERPNDPQLAANLATRYLRMGNLDGDPRFYGHARAALRPWWEAPSPPPAILKLRAKLQEKDHDYDRALSDLHLLLSQQPRDTQALIEVANIYRVQGKYAEALQIADRLVDFSESVPIVLCRAPIRALTGRAEEAYQSLDEILPTARERFPSTVQWIVTLQADIAQALGREKEAEHHFRQGLAREPDDNHLLRAYADFLLDRDRCDEALTILRDHVSDNGILLRAAIAARRSGNKSLAADWQSELENRFEEIRLRGSEPHGRYEARCALELQNNPQRALELALANWRRQKESRDTRNLLESALAAKQPAAANAAVEFITASGNQDVVLGKLVRQLERQEP
jgi:tetratricopeptide (TPR) repeat protein